jgi:riboflavin synthase
MTIAKGSITINGISLTVMDSSEGSFSVALIPYTWSETNMHLLTDGDKVNLEFDIFGKYISKMMADRL